MRLGVYSIVIGQFYTILVIVSLLSVTIQHYYSIINVTFHLHDLLILEVEVYTSSTPSAISPIPLNPPLW